MASRDNFSLRRHGAARRGGPTFFACAKKVGKESTPRRSARRTRRVRSPGRNFRAGHPRIEYGAGSAPYENGARPVRRPAGFTRRDCRTSGAPRAAFAVAHAFRVPMRHGEWAGQNPKGAVMDDGVSVWHMDVPYGNSRPTCGPGAKRRACRLGRVSLVPFFARAKKGMPPRRAAPCSRQPRSILQGHEKSHRGSCRHHVKPQNNDFVAPHPNPSPGGRGA